MEFMVEHPGDFLGLVWRKTVFLVSGFENSDNADLYNHRDHSNLYSILLWKTGLFFPFGALLPVALMGVWVLRRRWRELLPVYIFVVAYVPSIVLFLVTARHRLPLVPFLIILAAGGVATLVRRWKSLSIRERAIPIAILIATLFLFNQTWFGQQEVRGEFQTHFNMGIQYEKEGNLEKAEAAYQAADAAYPASATLLNNLGHVQYQLGKTEQAERNYNRSLELDPEFPPTLNNLGLLMRDKGEIDSAIVLFRKAARGFNPDVASEEDVGQAWLNLADAFDRSRMLDSTAAAYEMAMKQAPDWSRPYAKAAAFYARHQGYRIADSLFMEAADRGDMTAVDAFNWGLALIQGGRPHHGRGLMHRAINMEPGFFEAYYCIALAHVEEEAPRDSVLHYLDKALEINPDYEPAKKLYETVLSEGD
jgi:tetratricopeptide (TPR) repeat protein